jgi:anti-sigma regulatory factor (Ser/Thr protein kinase)
MASASVDAASARGLDHPAFFYESADEFVEVMAPFVLEGVAKGEPVVLAVGPSEVEALHDGLGSLPAGVQLADTREWHPHPASRLRAFYELVGDELSGGASRVRLVGEPVWPEGPPEYALEWARYESVLNEILGRLPVTLVCTYDTSRLDPAIVSDAAHTHPIVRDGAEKPSPDYEQPADLLTRWSSEIDAPPASAERIAAPTDLAAARNFVGAAAVRAGVHPRRAAELCVAASEILTNCVVHGGGAVGLSCWTDDGRFLCQIEDRGRGISDPLAGYRPVDDAAETGRGLWLARQLVDLVQVAGGPHGTTVRLHVALPAAPPAMLGVARAD